MSSPTQLKAAPPTLELKLKLTVAPAIGLPSRLVTLKLICAVSDKLEMAPVSLSAIKFGVAATNEMASASSGANSMLPLASAPVEAHVAVISSVPAQPLAI